MAVKRLEVVIAGDARGAQKALGAVDKKAGVLHSTFVKVGIAAGAAFAVKFGADAVKGAAADEQAQAKLAQTLEKTVGARQKDIAGVEKWITAQGKAVGITDDELRPALARAARSSDDLVGAQKKVSLAMDIATATGKPLQAVTDALAKASDGQTRALKQLGIQVRTSVPDSKALQKAQVAAKEAQEKYTEAVKKHGETSDEAKAAYEKVFLATLKVNDAQTKTKDVAKGWGAIQDDLNKKFGGDAANAADTTAGKYKIFSTRMGELKESIGAGLLPVLGALAGFMLDKVVPAVEATVGWFGEHKEVMIGIGAVLGPLVVLLGAYAAAQKVSAAATAIATAGQWAWNAAMSANPIVLVVLGLAALAVGVKLAYDHFAWFKVAVDTTWQALQTGYNWVKSNWPLLLGVLTGPFGLAVLAITRNWDELVGFIQAIPGRIGGALSHMWDGMKSGFRSAINWVIDKWNDFKIPAVKVLGIQVSPTINFPNIPKLHDGGVFRAPTPGGEGLALLRDRERVLTPGQSARAGFGGDGGPTVIVQITGSVVTERQLHQAIREGIRQLDREAS